MSESRQKMIDACLATAVKAGGAPGIVAAVTDASHTLYQSAAGRMAADEDAPMRCDAIFQIASMTKSIASTVIVLAVERGALDLTSPISRWDAAAAELRVLAGYQDGKPAFRAPSRDITLFDLLTHTSGLVYRNWDDALDRFVQKTSLPFLYSGDERGWFPPLLFDPGEKWTYGTSIDWAGRILQAATGRSLAAWIEDELLNPLGMTDTGYELKADMAARRAGLHERRDGDISMLPFAEPYPVTGAGGFGLYSSAGDFLRFIRLFLNDGWIGSRQILAPASVALLRRNAIPHLPIRPLKSTDLNRQADLDFFPEGRLGWSLGFMTNDAPLFTGRAPGSMAWSGIFNTHFWIDPDRNLGGVFLSQILPFAGRESMKSYTDFETAAYSAYGA